MGNQYPTLGNSNANKVWTFIVEATTQPFPRPNIVSNQSGNCVVPQRPSEQLFTPPLVSGVAVSNEKSSPEMGVATAVPAI
ncbi:hypothetical protein DL770_002057 [Monosporascus sp. CRB-9-2]|nr:hypothetical protein DL770_002057 [Monosporascus sp. CRB-9-2]